MPAANDYRLGDVVKFTVEGSAKIDTALTAGTEYHVVARTDTTISVSATAGGAAIALNGDGGATGSGIASLAAATAGVGYTAGTYTNVNVKQGANVTAKATVVVPVGGALAASAITITAPGTGYTTSASSISLEGGSGPGGAAIDASAPTTAFSGTATLTTGSDTPGAANHIAIDVSDYDSVCQVREFSIDITREELDVTTLPCGANGGGASKYASFRKTQAGYASGTGTMSVYFTDDQTSLANRLLANVMLKSQQGAAVKLYVNAVAGTGGAIDDTKSLLIESDISITSMSLSVNPDDATTAELSFSIVNPKNILGAAIG